MKSELTVFLLLLKLKVFLFWIGIKIGTNLNGHSLVQFYHFQMDMQTRKKITQNPKFHANTKKSKTNTRQFVHRMYYYTTAYDKRNNVIVWTSSYRDKPVSSCTHPNERNLKLSQRIFVIFFLFVQLIVNRGTTTTSRQSAKKTCNWWLRFGFRDKLLRWKKKWSYQLRWNYEIHISIGQYKRHVHLNRIIQAAIEQFSD